MKKTVKEKQEESQNPSDLHAQVLSVSIEGDGMDVFMRSVHRSMQVCKDIDVLIWRPEFDIGYLPELLTTFI